MSSSRQVQRRGTIGGVGGSSKGRGGRAGSADSDVQMNSSNGRGGRAVSADSDYQVIEQQPKCIDVGVDRLRHHGQVIEVDVVAHPYRNRRTGGIDVEYGYWGTAPEQVDRQNFMAPMGVNVFDNQPAGRAGFYWADEFSRAIGGHGITTAAARKEAIIQACCAKWRIRRDELDTAPYDAMTS